MHPQHKSFKTLNNLTTITGYSCLPASSALTIDSASTVDVYFKGCHMHALDQKFTDTTTFVDGTDLCPEESGMGECENYDIIENTSENNGVSSRQSVQLEVALKALDLKIYRVSQKKRSLVFKGS